MARTDVETAAVDQTDPLAVLLMLMHMLIRSEVDPYLLNGALIDGIAATIMQRVPTYQLRSGERLRLKRCGCCATSCGRMAPSEPRGNPRPGRWVRWHRSPEAGRAAT
jgi:hypothetical protein